MRVELVSCGKDRQAFAPEVNRKMDCVKGEEIRKRDGGGDVITNTSVVRYV